jgi:hypothetical protein
MTHTKHAHAHCAHTHVSYCATCQVVYCHDCAQEWTPKTLWCWPNTYTLTGASATYGSGTLTTGGVVNPHPHVHGG